MNKKQLIKIVSSKTNQTQKATEEFLDSLVDSITEALLQDERVVISGFGVFELRERKARNIETPINGETIITKEKKVPAFKVGRAYKDSFVKKYENRQVS